MAEGGKTIYLVSFQTGDIYHLTFEPESFDHITTEPDGVFCYTFFKATALKP